MRNQSSRGALFKTECDFKVFCATKTTKAFICCLFEPRPKLTPLEAKF